MKNSILKSTLIEQLFHDAKVIADIATENKEEDQRLLFMGRILQIERLISIFGDGIQMVAIGKISSLLLHGEFKRAKTIAVNMSGC